MDPVSDTPRGDRRPPRRDSDRGRRGDSAGPKQPPRGAKPAHAGRPHPSMGARPRRDESDEPDNRSVRPRILDPVLPEDVSPNDLPKDVRNELKTLTVENQEHVACHLAMAARLIEEDPEKAHEHALSASRRGGRIGVVRETLAITAYRTGDYALALRELRTYRRITGRDDQLPLMVDSERGLGRPARALELARSVPRGTLPVPVQVELAIAMSGARLDLGQTAEALMELEIPQLNPDVAYAWSPGLFDAYATVLEELGRDAEAAEWFRLAEVAAEALEGDDDDELIEITEFSDGDDLDEAAEPAADAPDATEGAEGRE